MRFRDKVVLVTGAGRGIGAELALAFAREGADIAVNDLSLERLDEVIGLVKNDCHRRAVPLAGNVGSAEDVTAMVATALKELGKIDILVNNAGTGQEVVPLAEQSLERWDRVISTHLRGTFLFSQQVGKAMMAQKSGIILNMSSVAGYGAFPMRTSYGPAKAAIMNLTKVLAVDLAPYGIRVNAIAPGYTATPLVVKAKESGNIEMDAILKRTPLGRLARTEEIAKAALFLASDDASYITGITLPVDGGWLAYNYV
jgi:NAD(P)-dependent dehydrogenase (short-subunit alcohol dehydrogenase family)